MVFFLFTYKIECGHGQEWRHSLMADKLSPSIKIITPPQTLQYSSHCCTSCASACLHAHVYQQHVTNTIACSSNFQETALPLLLRWFHLPYKANHLITFCPWDNSLISLYFSEANKTWYRPNTSCAVGALQFFRVVWLVDYPYIPHTRNFSRGS